MKRNRSRASLRPLTHCNSRLMLAAKTWPLILDWELPWGDYTFSVCSGSQSSLGQQTLTFFTTGYIPPKSSALSLCLIMLSGFSHSSFWFALRNVTSADLDWPSEGFCTLGGFSIGPRCLFLRDAFLDYASLPKNAHMFGSEMGSSLEHNSFSRTAFHCFSVINCSPPR